MCKLGQQYPIFIPDFITLRYNAPEQPKRISVCIDYCLIPEIYSLWKQGIVTMACCCGHGNKKVASILVEDEFIEKMKELGYQHWCNRRHPKRQDGFIPKTVNN